MVTVPGDTFDMGDPWGEGHDDELPVHSVTLSAYEIGMFEVTNQEYADMLNYANGQGYLTIRELISVTAYGHEVLDLGAPSCQIDYAEGAFTVGTRLGRSMATFPVIEVTWYGAAAYCNWLSETKGLQVCYDTTSFDCDFTKDGYHLPTEAQWEYAAAWDGARHWRYGTRSDFISCATANYNPVEGYCDPMLWQSPPYTSDVGLLSTVTSPVGCFDMSGNVWEWCNDWHDDEYYSPNPVTDPAGPDTGAHRVARGGGWSGRADKCRTADRVAFVTMEDDPSLGYVGFRIAK